MRKLLSLIAVCAAITATNAHAQALLTEQEQSLDVIAETEIVPLSDIIEQMSDAELIQMEETALEVGTLTLDVEQMIETAVEDAVSTGSIGFVGDENAAAVIEIVNANAEFFDFDILDEIATVIAEGEFTEAQIRQTLEGFNRLSDADKALVGQQAFDTGDANPLYQQVSAAGKAIIATMPVLQHDDDDDVDDVVPPPAGQ
jgi:hypothetical protein